MQAGQVSPAEVSSAVERHHPGHPVADPIPSIAQLEVLGEERVLGGTCKIISLVVKPGHIAHRGVDPVISVGEPDGTISDRVRSFRDLFERAGVKVDTPADIQVAIWEKFLIMAAVSGLGALTRVPVGVFRSVPETRELLLQAMTEVAAVARARKIGLTADVVERSLTFLDTLPPEGTSSIQRDVMQRRPSEIDALSGAVVRLGRETGVPTPVNELMYRCLLPMELEVRKSLPTGARWVR